MYEQKGGLCCRVGALPRYTEVTRCRGSPQVEEDSPTARGPVGTLSQIQAVLIQTLSPFALEDLSY